MVPAPVATKGAGGAVWCHCGRRLRCSNRGKVLATFRLAHAAAAGGSEWDCTSCTAARRNVALGCTGLPLRNPLPRTDPVLPAGWRSPLFGLLHAGLANRVDLPDAPLWHCPAMQVTAETMEWCGLYSDAAHGAHVARELWPPVWRDTYRALRHERKQMDDALRAAQEG
jgi:hypothetical protein